MFVKCGGVVKFYALSVASLYKKHDNGGWKNIKTTLKDATFSIAE